MGASEPRPEAPDPATPESAAARPTLRHALRALGPGLVAGASDTDPTTVAAVAVIGATTVFGLAWLALLVAPALIVVQVIATRLGVLGGTDLPTAARARFRPPVQHTIALSIVAVTVLTLAADLSAGAAAIGLLVGASTPWLVAPLAAVIVVLLVVGTSDGVVRVLKYLTLVLLAYVVSAALTHVNWTQALHHSFVPSFSLNHDDIAGALALVGTTITSYVFVWQTIELGRARRAPERLASTEVDAASGIVFAVIIVWFILVATGATLGVHHQQVQTAQDAARALRPLAGDAASTVFGLGLLGSALIAVPVLMSTAAYVVGAEFDWRRGLSEPVSRAPRFYAALVVTSAAAVLATLVHVSPIRLLFYASIAGGIGTPIALGCMVVLARDPTVMRGRPIGSPLHTAGWVVTATMGLMSGLYVLDQLGAFR
ncbi:MAG TPA: divalent metal cation transporter [Acidimicrobiia bacterium]|nr:divalent metal cation transporter [Acidimicrobiia bacterium]